MTAYNELGLLPVEMCSSLIDEQTYRIYPWSLPNNASVKYADVINYSRRYCLDQEAHNCVMCGKHNVVIPSQNKDVCKTCDSNCWYNSKLNVVFKFCKGCKNFFSLEEFREKPEASKCGKCRKRGRENYINKKMESGYYMTDSLSPRNVPDSHIVGEEYCSSGCPSVATVIEEEGMEGGPCIPLQQELALLQQMKKDVVQVQRRPPKVPKRSSPCSEARSAMNGYGTPSSSSGSGSGSDSETFSLKRERSDSITQLIACSERLDDSCLIIPAMQSTESLCKKQRIMAMMQAQQRTPRSASADDINVVTPAARSYFMSMSTAASSPISSLHCLNAVPTPSVSEEGIRGASPARSILKSASADDATKFLNVKTETLPGAAMRSRQVSFGHDSICSPPSSSAAAPAADSDAVDWRWDPSVNPLLNLAALVSTATAEKV